MPIKPSGSSKSLLNTARVTRCIGRSVKVDVIVLLFALQYFLQLDYIFENRLLHLYFCMKSVHSSHLIMAVHFFPEDFIHYSGFRKSGVTCSRVAQLTSYGSGSGDLMRSRAETQRGNRVTLHLNRLMGDFHRLMGDFL